MRKRKLIEIGYLSIGMRKKYTASYVRDSEGRCDKIDVMVGDLPDLGNIRYPSFTKVEKFLNSEEGLELLEKLNGKPLDFYKGE